MDMEALIAHRDRLIRAGEEKNRQIQRLERKVRGLRKTVWQLDQRLRDFHASDSAFRTRGRCGQLYVHISDALQRLVLDDVDGAGEILARALSLTDEELDDLAYATRLRADEQRRVNRGPSAIRGPGRPRPKIKPSKRRAVMARDGHRCRNCGRQGTVENPLTVDHIVPLSHGGNNERRNLQTLCWRCNLRKAEREFIPPEPIDLERYELRLVPRKRSRTNDTTALAESGPEDLPPNSDPAYK